MGSAGLSRRGERRLVEVKRFRGLAVKALMRPAAVVEGEVARNASLGGGDAVVGVQVDCSSTHRCFWKFWCPRTDLNRHSFRNWILNPARLPIPPLGRSVILPVCRNWGPTHPNPLVHHALY